MVQHFSRCPFCGHVFEHDGAAREVDIDKHRRRVCEPCAKKQFGSAAELSPPEPLPEPNGGLHLRPADELAAGV